MVGGNQIATYSFNYTQGNTYRWLIFFDPDVAQNKLFYEYSSNINDSLFKNNRKLTSGSGGYNNFSWWIRESGEHVLYVGGTKTKTQNYKGTIEKIIIFNRADPNLIFTDF